MLGKRGGGYIFDTNSIHKGEVIGNVDRTAFMLEFNKYTKSEILLTNDKRNRVPCPSNVYRTDKILSRPSRFSS